MKARLEWLILTVDSVFVDGRSRQVIMGDMKERIERGDERQERIDAIQAMCDIAKDRAKKMAAA